MMARNDVASFAAAILGADDFDARRAAIALVVCAQSLVKDDPVESRILADTMRAVAAELDAQNGQQSSMN